MVDVLSRGRLEAGFVRGVPYEVLPANSNPVRMNEREWEAHDLIVKAWTTHDGPFSREGRYFHYRAVNIWPRCYQQPHPPIWISAPARPARARVGARGYVQATLPHRLRRHAHDLRRVSPRLARGGRGTDVPAHRLAYAAIVYIARTRPSARGAREAAVVLDVEQGAAAFRQSARLRAGARQRRDEARRRASLSAFRKAASVEGAIEAGIMFAGTPDQVHRQMKKLYDHVGGFGHLLIMGQAGFLEHDETVKGIRTFARELYPRLKEEFPDIAITGVAR